MSSLEQYLADSRALVLAHLEGFLADEADGPLRALMMDYPLRPAKALRPALCIATCRALGGHLDAVAPSAAVLELFHNAFLLHDDVEDGSELRRGGPTLHRAHGMPIAINVGDAMFAFALQPLLDNVDRVGLGASLEVLQVVASMCRQTVRGQALELDWIAHQRWDLGEADYVAMVGLKTGWYTFLAPMWIGGILAGAQPEQIAVLQRMARALGTAFQIQDDLLNLEDAADYGKERDGDLLEGKRTLILLTALGRAGPRERAAAIARLDTPREQKRPADVAWLRALIHRTEAAEIARSRAQADAALAAQALSELAPVMGPSPHLDFLHQLVAYVHTRRL